ncbi:trypsin-like peptidase domain-containing protein [Kutzneria viridogrisea]|uniref:Serine protease PepD n=2 Tax=Kutzneria TaxID=43356 RepID=W5W016_9PSEU|nr:trypsin-like peptidase domain-containing protein [Kutzneria albida]AHH94105.1 serine protease PepD [Kutzneria albida DSM 43870]MBA8929777.1 putative serine protease PepD [Kutzneria viridogrisea]
MTENFPGAAGSTPERPEQSADQAAQQGASTPPPATGSTPPSTPQSPWAPGYTGQPAGQGAPGHEQPAQVQGLPGQEPPTGQWQQGPQPFGGYQTFDGQQGPTTVHMPVAEPRRSGGAKLVVGVTVLALLVGGGAGALGGYLFAQQGGQVINALNAPAPAKNASNVTPGSVTDVANKVAPAVVEIKTQEGEGSGIVVTSDGTILTNNHVIASAAGGGQIEVDFSNGKKAAAVIIGRDPTTDVAVIKAQNVSGLTTAQLGRSDDLQIGQQVVAIGSPFDLAGTVTTGIVSSLHRPVNVGSEQPQTPRGRGNGGGLGNQGQSQDQGQTSQATVLDAIQTDASINPGNSGGPLLNMQGQVIGINSAISSPGSSAQSQGGSVGIGFAIPVDQAKRTAQQIQQTGKATQTLLGVTVGNADSGGASVQTVTAGGAAEQAGLKPGDVVTKLNDRAITTSDSLVAAVHAQAPGDKVTLTLASGKTVEATLTGVPVNVQN